jgi:carbonic anhydrase
MKRDFALAVLVCALCGISAHAQILAAAAGVNADDFAYSGDKGPGFWPELHGKDGKEFSACAPSPSARQSPIDIETVVEDPALRPLDVSFVEAPFVMKNLGFTIQVTPAFGSSLTLDGRNYSLLQFTFILSRNTLWRASMA